MKNYLILLFLIISICSFSQKQHFDLVTYAAPKGWKKEVKETAVSYTISNDKTKTWCQINIVKSTTSKGSVDLDFDSEWQELIVKSYQPSSLPKSTEIKGTGLWKTKSGASKFSFNNADALVMLTVSSGYNRCVSILVTTNSQEYIRNYETLLASVELKKPVIVADQTLTTNADNNSIAGTWAGSASDQSSYLVKNAASGYITRQYNFAGNGTYSFYSRTSSPLVNELLLVRESGTYQVNGNTITVIPQKSVTEAWTKKNGMDQWGKRINSQNRKLEKVTYQFTKHYLSGTKETDLILMGNGPTLRDGPCNTFNNVNNAWYYGPISRTNYAIVLPD